MLKRIKNIIVNWIFFITVPLWGGLFLCVMFLRDLIKGDLAAKELANGTDNVLEEILK